MITTNSTTTTVASDAREIIKKQLWERLDKLPQRDLIASSDATQWIDYMSNFMPDQAMWHMVRAGGVGGSEIGGLIRNYLGHPADHGFSAHDWALSKLLRKIPEPSHGAMQRGHDMEPIHAERFYRELGVKRDKSLFDRLAQASGKHVWMRYSPDDLVVFENPTQIEQADGPIVLSGPVLVDYKAPTSVDEESRISFQYSCQLHQGAILCEEQGIELSGTMLSQFNWAKWSLKNDFVAINPELCDLIKEAGNHYWDYVMRGAIPDYVTKQRFSLDEKLRNDWTQAANRLSQLNAMNTCIGNAADALREQIISGMGLRNMRMDGQALVFPGALKIASTVSINETKVRQALGEDALEPLMVKEKAVKYDTDALVQKLKSLDVDVKPYRKLMKLEPSLTFDALVNAGLNPEDFMSENPRMSVEKEIKAMAEDWFKQNFEPLALPESSNPTEHKEDVDLTLSFERPVG